MLSPLPTLTCTAWVAGRAARPALIRGIHRHRAFTGCGGQSGSALMRVHLCLALEVSHRRPARQEHWSKWACSYWNGIHSRHCTCNLLSPVWRYSSELCLPERPIKRLLMQQRRGYSEDNASKATQWLDVAKCLTGTGPKRALCRWKYISPLCSAKRNFVKPAQHNINPTSTLAFSCTQGRVGCRGCPRTKMASWQFISTMTVHVMCNNSLFRIFVMYFQLYFCVLELPCTFKWQLKWTWDKTKPKFLQGRATLQKKNPSLWNKLPWSALGLSLLSLFFFFFSKRSNPQSAFPLFAAPFSFCMHLIIFSRMEDFSIHHIF